MSVFVISDLHLSFGVPQKSMTVFHGWENYEDRIKAAFLKRVKKEDTVILGGDTSWALKLEETYKDFAFLESLPGKKVLIKGNHDLWWSTANKMKTFIKDNNFNNLEILFNNCVIAEDYAICGTRGWFYESADEKILNREAARLERSIQAGEKSGKKVVVILHYPPVYGEYVCTPILDVLKKHNIKKVYCGHIHGLGFNNAVKEYDGIVFKLVSCDLIEFSPLEILD